MSGGGSGGGETAIGCVSIAVIAVSPAMLCWQGFLWLRDAVWYPQPTMRGMLGVEYVEPQTWKGLRHLWDWYLDSPLSASALVSAGLVWIIGHVILSDARAREEAKKAKSD